MPRLMNTTLSALAVLVVGMGLAACNGAKDPNIERAALAKAGTGDVVIGAAWPWEIRGTSLYGNGMDLAVEEVNATGGILGRPLRLVRADDQESVNQGRVVAQNFADDPRVVAVVGHLQSYVSMSAAPIYDRAGLVMVSPYSTTPKLTEQGYRYVFRSTFNDVQVGHRMAEIAKERGYDHIALLYLRDTYGRDLANAFEQRASQLGLDVVDRQSYTPAPERAQTSFRTVLEQWKDYEFDAVFLASAVPEAGRFIALARAEGITVPILGGDAMDNQRLIDHSNGTSDGTIVASVFHPDDPRPEVTAFVAQFKVTYGKKPDAGAAAGYDAVKLLAHAMETAGTTDPEAVAETLRTMKPYAGIRGTLAFNEQGDLSQNVLITKIVRDGKFEFLASASVAAGDAVSAVMGQ